LLVYSLYVFKFSSIDFTSIAHDMEGRSLSYFIVQYGRFIYYMIKGFFISDHINAFRAFALLCILAGIFFVKEKKTRVPLLFFLLSMFLFFLPFVIKIGYSFRFGSLGLTMFAPLIVLVTWLFIRSIFKLVFRKKNSSLPPQKMAYASTIVFFLIFSFFNLKTMHTIEKEWEEAGRMAEELIMSFVEAYPEPPPGKTAFLNIPFYHNRALVFITGFEHALADRYRALGKNKPREEIVFYPGVVSREEILEEHGNVRNFFIWFNGKFEPIARKGHSPGPQ
jgi:hypothetical protein